MRYTLMARPVNRSWAVVLLAATVAALTGCQAGMRRPEQIRAIWVTRWDYKTENDVVRIMENCENLGMNTVVFQVRGNGTVFYPSTIEPWAEEFDFQDPGFDPLAVAVREAHQRGMLLEAWMNVLPAWRGGEPPTEPSQLYHTHPEWFWYDQYGNRQALSERFYVSLNPCLPEVRDYIVRVFGEVAAHYAIDGIHMDYIRFPSEPPATPRGTDIDYPYDEKTLALYKADTGHAPKDDPEGWTQWRADQLTELVSEIHAMLKRTRQNAVLTASVGPDPERHRTRYFQDSRRWVSEGLVEAAYVMNYTPDLVTFSERLSHWTQVPDGVDVVPGINVNRAMSPEGLLAQVRTAEELDGNFCLFAYSSFFDREAGEASEKQAEMVKAVQGHLSAKP